MHEAGIPDLQDFLRSFTTTGNLATLIQHGPEVLRLTVKKLASEQALSIEDVARLGDIRASQALLETVVAIYKYASASAGHSKSSYESLCATVHNRVVPAVLDSILFVTGDDLVRNDPEVSSYSAKSHSLHRETIG